MKVIEYFNLPKLASQNRRIPVQTLVDVHELNKPEELMLRDHIQSIYLIGVLNEQTVHLKAQQDEKMLYEEIQILSVNLRDNKKVQTLDEALHSYFPNPTLIVYQFQLNFMFSTALKHLHQSIEERSVVDERYTSYFSDLGDEENMYFLNTLNLNDMKVRNLKDLYNRYSQLIYQQRLIKITETYPRNDIEPEILKSKLSQIENLQSKLNTLKEEAKSSKMMRSKMENHMQQKTIEDEINQITKSLKEVS